MTAVVVKYELQPFSERSAAGQYWLKDLENGVYREEFYVAHISMPPCSALPGSAYAKQQIFLVEMVLLS